MAYILPVAASVSFWGGIFFDIRFKDLVLFIFLDFGEWSQIYEVSMDDHFLFNLCPIASVSWTCFVQTYLYVRIYYTPDNRYRQCLFFFLVTLSN